MFVVVNTNINLILRRPPFLGGHLEGWPGARPSQLPSFETRRKDAALLRMRSVVKTTP
jgi:hypothetical protein